MIVCDSCRDSGKDRDESCQLAPKPQAQGKAPQSWLDEYVCVTSAGLWQGWWGLAQASLQPQDQCSTADRAPGGLRSLLWPAHPPVCCQGH